MVSWKGKGVEEKRDWLEKSGEEIKQSEGRGLKVELNEDIRE